MAEIIIVFLIKLSSVVITAWLSELLIQLYCNTQMKGTWVKAKPWDHLTIAELFYQIY